MHFPHGLPPSSGSHSSFRQDFNALENVWKTLKDQLDEALPKHLETRDEFIARLHKAVSWVNRNRADQLWFYSTNQKQRARGGLATKSTGSRTGW